MTQRALTPTVTSELDRFRFVRRLWKGAPR
jgi:hypothetical protein